jgi:amino acid adenylation domain-containing protein
VLLDRTPELVVAQLAVLEAGGAYVAMDPGSPAERVATMLRRSGAVALLTRAGLAGAVPQIAVEVLDVDSVDPEGTPEDWESAVVEPSHLAYVIFTSGSTGEPKGVAVPHGGLANLVAWHRREYAVTARDRASLVAGLGFDASVWELWPYLTAGASVHLPAAEVLASPPALSEWIERQGITVGFLPTPLAEAVLAERPPRGALRALLTGGDRLHAAPAAGLGFSLVNHYGPTESTVVATRFRVEPGAEGLPPIGRPIDNTRVFVLDRWGQPVPAGAVGELAIAGAGLARGYAGRPEATAERFVPDPFEGVGERLYRTGDLGRWRADGELEFLGRADRQVKVRGIRIEPAEVESTLVAHPRLGKAAVVALPERDGSPHLRLVAYVVAREEPAPSDEELRGFLQQRLPAAMVPAVFVSLASLPLTANGKVDRAALPRPDGARPRSAQTYVAPRTPLEEILAEVWSDLLGVARPGVHDDLFALGAHSLLVTQAISRIRDSFGVELSPRAIYEYPSISGLSIAIARALIEGTERPLVEQALAGMEQN